MSDHGIHPTCPECGSQAVTQLRRWQDRKMKAVRGWRVCQKCRRGFRVKQGRAETLRRMAIRQRAAP